MKRNWGRRKYISMKTLREVWDAAKKKGILYNGMTFDLLRQKLDSPIYHKIGVGFFYYPNGPRLEQTCEA